MTAYGSLKTSISTIEIAVQNPAFVNTGFSFFASYPNLDMIHFMNVINNYAQKLFGDDWRVITVIILCAIALWIHQLVYVIVHINSPPAINARYFTIDEKRFTVYEYQSERLTCLLILKDADTIQVACK